MHAYISVLRPTMEVVGSGKSGKRLIGAERCLNSGEWAGGVKRIRVQNMFPSETDFAHKQQCVHPL